MPCENIEQALSTPLGRGAIAVAACVGEPAAIIFIQFQDITTF
jgi:hypothetical protein